MNSGYGYGQPTTGGNYKPTYFYCYVDNGNIVQVDPYNTNSAGKVIGVTSQTYEYISNELNELNITCAGYYDKLVEEGFIKVPKTAEEISIVQSEIFEKILARLEKLEQKEIVSDNEHTENI